MLILMLTKCIDVDDGATTPFFAIDDSLPHACWYNHVFVILPTMYNKNWVM